MTASAIRSHLRRHGSKARAASAQRYFKEKIVSYGWPTRQLELYARQIASQLNGDADLVALADELSRGPSNEEFHLACFLLERLDRRIPEYFPAYLRMLGRVNGWSKCDHLTTRLIGPTFIAKPALARHAPVWARSKNLWKRRAAAASLVIPARRGVLQREILAVADRLLADPEDMVQKGLGWLLRELAKASPDVAVPYLLRIRTKTSRLVLRTACETLSTRDRKRILN